MNTVINIRTNKEIRNKAKKVFSSMGLSTSAGVNMFLHQVVAEKGIPFTPTADPKKIRKRWDDQVIEAQKSKKYKNAKGVLSGL
jgi:DNA-damage-inducible protein J